MPGGDGGRWPRDTSVSPWLVGALLLVVLVVLANTLALRWALTIWGGSVLVVLIAVGLIWRRGNQNTPQHTAHDRGLLPGATATTVEPPPSAVTPDTHGPRPGEVPGTMPVVMTADETAQYLRVDSAEVVAAISTGVFPGNRIGEQWRVRSDSLLAWLDGPYVAPPKPKVPRRRTPPPAA